jgi:hypothetical protein
MGLAGVLTLVPRWAPPAGVAGGVFQSIAWALHLGSKGKTAAESLATWTDLLAGAAVVVFALHELCAALPVTCRPR